MNKRLSVFLITSLLGLNLYASENIFYNFDNDPKVQESIGKFFKNKQKRSDQNNVLIKNYNKTDGDNKVSNNEIAFSDYNENENQKMENENIKMEMGVNVQYNEISGYMRSNTNVNYFQKSSAETDNNANTGNLALEDKVGGGVWLDIKFKDSIFPNIKMSYNYYYNKGTSTYITNNTKLFKDVEIKNNYGNATSELTINSFDINAYYTFKDFANILSRLDLGIGMNFNNINYTLTDNIENKKVIDTSQNIIVPYLSLFGETKDINGISLIGGIKVSNIGENKYFASKVGVKYKRKVNGYSVSAGIGYNYDEKEYKNGEYKTVLRYQGPYAELGIDF